jgi:hypothetical protein
LGFHTVPPNTLFLAAVFAQKGGCFIVLICQRGGERTFAAVVFRIEVRPMMLVPQNCIAFVPHSTAAWMCHPSFSVVTFFCDLQARKRDESHYSDPAHLD